MIFFEIASVVFILSLKSQNDIPQMSVWYSIVCIYYIVLMYIFKAYPNKFWAYVIIFVIPIVYTGSVIYLIMYPGDYTLFALGLSISYYIKMFGILFKYFQLRKPKPVAKPVAKYVIQPFKSNVISPVK